MATMTAGGNAALMVLAAVILGALLLGGLVLVGCKFPNLPPIELCYIHPTYGQVCVKLGGVTHYAETLTPAQRAEVEAWIKAGAPGNGGTAAPPPTSPPSTPSSPP